MKVCLKENEKKSKWTLKLANKKYTDNAGRGHLKNERSKHDKQQYIQQNIENLRLISTYIGKSNG